MIISVLEQNPSREERRERTSELIDQLVTTTDDLRRRAIIDQLILTNIGVAQAMARRFRGRGIPDDDLDQVAYLALVKAAQKFDPAQDRDFLTYAVPTMSGELKRHFRDAGWTIRPPRRIQEIQSRVVHAYRAGQEAGEPPSPRRLAAELGLPEADVREALAADGCFAPTSLDQPLLAAGDEPVGRTLATDDATEREAMEARTVLGPALAKLTPRDRQVLSLRFVHEKTQSEIGEILGMTQMQVSRLLRRVIRELRAELGDEAAIA